MWLGRSSATKPDLLQKDLLNQYDIGHVIYVQNWFFDANSMAMSVS